jgi:hypothetical protein
MISYVNRHKKRYDFELQEDGNILWTGNFEYCRYGFPNDYSDAYMRYSDDVDTDERLTLGEFKNAVHEHGTDINRRYSMLVLSDLSKIDMVDPSGGPYLSSGYNMGLFSEKFKGMIISHFEMTHDGYKIIIKQ